MTSTALHLPTRKLGTTDMAITRVGLGAWAMGGPDWAVGWGAQDDAQSRETIHRAVECGLNWIDTAAIYGLGYSEAVVGAAVAELPEAERPYIFTKCGQVWDPADRSTKFRVGKVDSLRQELEDSLLRLKVERIDLYQMHWPAEDGTPLEEYWSTLVELRREGKVRAIGLSNHDVPQLERAEAIGHVDTLQPPFSAIHRKAAAELLPWCAANGTGVIIYSPMQSGLLTGGFSRERVASLPANDWRSRHPDFTGAALDANLAIADAFVPVAERHGVSRSAAAIAWTLAWPGVSGAIVGARTPAQVDDWIAAASFELDEADVAAIGEVIARFAPDSGPVLP